MSFSKPRVYQDPVNASSNNRQEYEAVNRQQPYSGGQPPVDPNLAKNLNRFSQHYHQQDLDRQSLKASIENFKKKSRAELIKEMEGIRMKKNIAIGVFIFCVAAIALAFLMFVASHSSRKPYCDTNAPQTEKCEPCPRNGICKGGRLVDCSGYYKLKGDICVEKQKNEKQIYFMYHDALDFLQRLHGDYTLANKKDGPGVDTRHLDEYLAKHHQQHEDYQDSFYEVKSLLRSPNNPDVKSESRDGSTYFTATNPKYTYYGWLKIFLMHHKLFVLGSCILVILCLVSIGLLNRELANRKEAENLYRLIEDCIWADPKHYKTEDELKRSLAGKTKLSRSDITSLWPYVRFEAESRQKVDFARRIQDGIEQTVWWIDRKGYN